MKTMFLCFFLLGASVALLAQTNPNLIGTWHAKENGFTMILILNANGTGTLDGDPIKFTVKGNTLAVTEDGDVNNYSFTLSGNTLKLSGGDLDQPMIFERQSAAPATGLGARRNQVVAKAPEDTPTEPAAKPKSNSLVGRWQGSENVVTINDNGTMQIAGENYRYAVAGNIITITGHDGSLPIPFELKGDTLHVNVNGQAQTLQRLKDEPKGKAGAGGIRQELVGKWCYFASVSANAGGGRMTEECFTLNADGTYTYVRESSASAYAPGIAGGTNSQGSDSGRWTATETSITAQSRSGQTTTYTLEKRNNKNNDPMLCLDGQCFATAYQKAPWR